MKSQSQAPRCNPRHICLFGMTGAVLATAQFSCSQKTHSEDGARAGDQPQTYPLTTCVVSGEELGSMGDPVVLEHQGTTVKLCCKQCIPKFEKDPETYLGKLNSKP